MLELGCPTAEIDSIIARAHADTDCELAELRRQAFEDAQDDLAKETARQIRNDMIYEEERERR